MSAPGDLDNPRETARRVAMAGIVAAVVAIALLLVAIVAPIVNMNPGDEGKGVASRELLKDRSSQTVELRTLATKVASMELMRPARVQAAVKDDGTALRLAKSLKLQGVAQIGDEYVAYIQVEKEGLAAVRERQELLQFTVEKIEPGRVTLSLQGVRVLLGR